MRPQSLRARVAAATALGATIVVAAVGVYLALAIARTICSSSIGGSRPRRGCSSSMPVAAAPFLNVLGDGGAFAVTIRAGEKVVSSTSSRLPELDPGSHTVDVAGTPFRTFTAPLGSRLHDPPDGGGPARRSEGSHHRPAAAGRTGGCGRDRRRHRGSAGSSVAAPSARWSNSPSASAAATATSPPRRPGSARPTSSPPRPAPCCRTSPTRRNAPRPRSTPPATSRPRPRTNYGPRSPPCAPTSRYSPPSTCPTNSAPRSSPTSRGHRAGSRPLLTALERLASGELSSEKDHVDLDLTELCDLAAEDAQRLRPDLTVTVDAPPGWSCVACRWDCGCRSTTRSATPSGTAAHGTCRSVRTATTTAPSRSPSTTTAPASRTRRGSRCSSASGAAAAPPRAARARAGARGAAGGLHGGTAHSRTAPSAARDWW